MYNTTVYKEIPLRIGRKFLATKKFSTKKSWKNIFSLKIKNRYLELKHIQRRASNSFSKCSNVSISYFFSNLSKPLRDLDTHLVTCSERESTFPPQLGGNFSLPHLVKGKLLRAKRDFFWFYIWKLKFVTNYSTNFRFTGKFQFIGITGKPKFSWANRW